MARTERAPESFEHEPPLDSAKAVLAIEDLREEHLTSDDGAQCRRYAKNSARGTGKRAESVIALDHRVSRTLMEDRGGRVPLTMSREPNFVSKAGFDR